MEHDYILALAIFLGATLYTIVGHAGASAYIAAMAFFSVPPLMMKPTALTLNIAVSLFASWRFVNAKYFDLKLLIPLLIGSIPMAFIGGYIQLPPHYYRPLVGVVLIVSALRFMFLKRPKVEEANHPNLAASVGAGGIIGLLSGLTGTGGGIFLSPLILFLGWTTTKTASGVAAVFILFNSIAGLLGNLKSTQYLPDNLLLFAIAALSGAVVGTYMGISYLSSSLVQKVLGAVLIVAGLKMLNVY